MDWSILVIIIQLIILEGLLSLDNAAVLGALVSHLPDDVPIHWPRVLQHAGERLQSLLGNQRTAALRVGLLGAYAGRAVMLLLAGLVIQNPWLKVLGAAYLVRLAFDNLGQAEPGEEDAHINPLPQRTFWSIVVTVELTDLVFSLDNVVAAVALSNKMWVVMLGVAIGILFMRFAAGWFSYLVDREPILKNAAYILVLNIGIELLVEHFYHLPISDLLRFSISISTIVLCVAYAHIKALRFFRPMIIWLAQGMANINELVDWLLLPVVAIVHLFASACRRLFSVRPTE